MNYFLKLLKPAPHKTEIADEDVLNKTFRYWRIRILYTMFFGYAVFYFTRMTFTFAMPELKPLGFDEVGLGWILTIGQISYGMSRFFSGILADRSNPRYLMAIGLMITGVINILFGLSTSLVLFMVFWGINGWFQGWGSAPCHRLITHWYSPNERGRWWGVWNTAHNIGAALIPFLAVFLISRSGWRLSMYVPGIIAIVVSLFIINRLRDTPQSLGLPPVEKWRNDTSAPPIRGVERELSTKEILFQYVLTNRYIWLLAVSYFMVYIVRWAVISWSYLFLVNSQGYSHWLAAFCFFGFEFGGFFGGMLAGWLSDVVFKGRRGPVNAIFMIAIVPAVLFFWYVSSYASMAILTTAAMGLLGFFIYGPQMLLSVAATELSHKKSAATAAGFMGVIAYVGSAMTGGPLGHIIRDFGWNYYFIIITVASVAGSLCVLPLWSVTKAPERKKKSDSIPSPV